MTAKPVDIRTTEVPPSAERPKRFVSPGLKRLLVRMGYAHTVELDQLEQKKGNAKAVFALCHSRSLSEAAVLAQMSKDLSLDCVSWNLETPTVWTPPQSEHGEFSKQFALDHRALPLSVSESEVFVALADPLDLETIADVEYLTKKRVRVLLASEGMILRAISLFYGEADSRAAAEAIAENSNEAPQELELIIGRTQQGEENSSEYNAAPIVKLVNRIMSDAVSAKASDVHFVPTASVLEIKFRVDGVISQHSTIPKRVQPYVLARLKLLSGMDIAERRRPQDGRFHMQINEKTTRDVRASVVPTAFGETMVLRIQGGSTEGMSLELLGLPAEMAKQVKLDLASTDQLILVVGPTGSGKTTTLYSAIRHLHDGTHTIITVEDPIEAKIDGLTQIQVDHKLGVTFASGLRSILRQDPDIVLIGEIRDLETAETAFQAAQTGHLVLSTLHTNDAPSTVTRLLDLGVEPFVVADSLRGVLAQRLVRRICPHCKKPASAEQKKDFESTFGVSGANLVTATGCDACDRSGFKGRIGVYSYLRIDAEVRELIRRRASLADVHRVAVRSGFQDLNYSALQFVVSGMTTLDEVERHIGRASMNELHVKVAAAPAPAKERPALHTEGLIAEPSSRKRKNTATLSIADLATGEADSASESSVTKVLLVDDDKGVRAVLVQLLKKEGFEVVEAKDGRQALDVAMRSAPDIVVCDLIMPGLNGLGFLLEFRKSEDFQLTPVLMLTGSDDEQNEIQLIDAGADDFVSKSSSPAVVVARMKRLLNRGAH